MHKSNYICTIPFGYSEVFKDRHYLCCPGWLNESVYETGNINNVKRFLTKHDIDLDIEKFYEYLNPKNRQRVTKLSAI